jgi:epoxyqueuosine reductase
MDKMDLINSAASYIINSADNYISAQIAISERSAGMKIFDDPIFAFGAAEDEYFTLMKEPQAIGEHFMLPQDWLLQAKTVISFFLPFSEAVRIGNRTDRVWPSEEWLHGRIEGQSLLNKLCSHLQAELAQAGYKSVVPSQDERFWMKAKFNSNSPHPEASFTSNWSERHAAFVCGLGTFGLSRGLITEKGISGRFGSIITELYLAPDKRNYTDIYEYCSMCGSCAKNCPVNAISVENGKDHLICSRFLDRTKVKYAPRYGCGKCQTGVPCEAGIPPRSSTVPEDL